VTGLGYESLRQPNEIRTLVITAPMQSLFPSAQETLASTGPVGWWDYPAVVQPNSFIHKSLSNWSFNIRDRMRSRLPLLLMCRARRL